MHNSFSNCKVPTLRWWEFFIAFKPSNIFTLLMNHQEPWLWSKPKDERQRSRTSENWNNIQHPEHQRSLSSNDVHANLPEQASYDSRIGFGHPARNPFQESRSNSTLDWSKNKELYENLDWVNRLDDSDAWNTQNTLCDAPHAWTQQDSKTQISNTRHWNTSLPPKALSTNRLVSKGLGFLSKSRSFDRDEKPGRVFDSKRSTLDDSKLSRFDYSKSSRFERDEYSKSSRLDREEYSKSSRLDREEYSKSSRFEKDDYSKSSRFEKDDYYRSSRFEKDDYYSKKRYNKTKKDFPIGVFIWGFPETTKVSDLMQNFSFAGEIINGFYNLKQLVWISNMASSMPFWIFLVTQVL
jgi:hypothetical protein